MIFLAIKSALQQENLNPEIEEKLLTLQRYQEKQMNTPSNHPDYGLSNDSLDFEDSQTSRRRRSPVSRKRPTTTHADDDDWVLDTPKKRASRAQNFPIEKRTNVVATSTLKDTSVKQQQESISVKNTQQVQKMQPLQEKVVEVPVKKVQNKQQVRLLFVVFFVKFYIFRVCLIFHSFRLKKNFNKFHILTVSF